MYRKEDAEEIFGPKRDEVTRGWKKLLNEEVHNFILFAKYN
jgi:hypothetical protein